MNFKEWCKRVVEVLNNTDRVLFGEAVECCSDDLGNDAPPQSEADAFLSWFRGDEPEDLFDAGDTPEGYAEFLVQEWRQFGPEGE